MREADITGIHPAAELFPILDDAELEELAEDIKQNGLLQSVLVYEKQILDGRNRMVACAKAEVKATFVEYKGSDPVAAVISLNIKRRHLNRQQKRDLIAKLLKMQPERSDRAVGKLAQASPQTVTSVRKDLEEGAQIEHHDTRVGTDGVSQPAYKPKAEVDPNAKEEDLIDRYIGRMRVLAKDIEAFHHEDVSGESLQAMTKEARQLRAAIGRALKAWEVKNDS